MLTESYNLVSLDFYRPIYIIYLLQVTVQNIVPTAQNTSIPTVKSGTTNSSNTTNFISI